MEFLSPARLWFVLIIPVIVAGYIFLQHRRAQYALRFTNIALLDRVAPRRPQWRRHLAVTLALLAALSCIVAFAQPKDQVKVPRERATIVVAIDVSLSMMATDIEPNRLEAAKESAKEFINSAAGQVQRRPGQLRRYGVHHRAADHRPGHGAALDRRTRARRVDRDR